MFKSQYSSNPIIFSPDGQLLQLNFSKKASDRGEISISIRSKNHIVLFGSLKSEPIQSNKETVSVYEGGEEKVKPIDRLTVKRRDVESKSGEIVVLESS